MTLDPEFDALRDKMTAAWSALGEAVSGGPNTIMTTPSRGVDLELESTVVGEWSVRLHVVAGWDDPLDIDVAAMRRLASLLIATADVIDPDGKP